MNTMDIVCGLYNTKVVIKDTETKTVRSKEYDYKEMKARDVMVHLYHLAKNVSIDEIHIDTNGFGIYAANFFSETDLKEKLRLLKHVGF